MMIMQDNEIIWNFDNRAMIWASHDIMIYRNPESMFVLEVPNGVNLIQERLVNAKQTMLV